MEIVLKEVAPDDPVALGLVEALRDEVEARGAHNGAGRPDRPLAEAVRTDCDTLVAHAGSEPAGIGALRPLEPGVAEIKRMYVSPAHRGKGIAGRLLAELEARALRRGFDVVRLDTHDRLGEAASMYRGAGYREIPDYNANPRSNLWFEKHLGREGT